MSTPKRFRFKLLRGSHVAEDGTRYQAAANPIIETDCDLRSHNPKTVRFQMLSDREAPKKEELK